jgi:hypothetical protein
MEHTYNIEATVYYNYQQEKDTFCEYFQKMLLKYFIIYIPQL